MVARTHRMHCSYQGVYMMAYARFRSWFGADAPDAGRERIVASAVCAGAVASATTSPIDLVKTRLQVQRSNPNVFQYNGAFHAAAQVWRQEGLLAFFDGVGARVLWLTPRMTAAMTVYELLCKMLEK